MLEAVGFPVAVNPESRLSAIARRRGWHVEHWAKARGRVAPAAAARTLRREVAQGGDGPVSTLLFERSLPRFAAARVVSSLRLGTRRRRRARCAWSSGTHPPCPADGWVHVDPAAVGHLRLRPGHPRRAQLALLRGHRLLPLRARATRWSAPLAEDAVGADGAPLAAGTRVVLQPVLGCAARGIEPPCPACQAGHVGQLRRISPSVTSGPACRPGSAPTPAAAGRRTGLVAHSSQLYAVPDGLSDADAVTVEPVACAVHAVLGAPHRATATSWPCSAPARSGLLVTAALSHLAGDGSLPVAVGAPRRGALRAPAAPGPRAGLHRGAARPTSWRAPCAGTRARCPTAARPA